MFWTFRPFTAPSKLHQMGISRVAKAFTDLCPLSVSNARKMSCNWFQTLIILWKEALRQRLNSLKTRVKYVVIIKNNRTTRALATYQSFVVKARNTHVEFGHHLHRAQTADDHAVDTGAAPSAFFHCSLSITAEIWKSHPCWLTHDLCRPADMSVPLCLLSSLGMFAAALTFSA